MRSHLLVRLLLFKFKSRLWIFHTPRIQLAGHPCYAPICVNARQCVDSHTREYSQYTEKPKLQSGSPLHPEQGVKMLGIASTRTRGRPLPFQAAGARSASAGSDLESAPRSGGSLAARRFVGGCGNSNSGATFPSLALGTCFDELPSAGG